MYTHLTHVGLFGRMQIFFDDYKSLLTHTGLFLTFQHTAASGVAVVLQLQMQRYAEMYKRDLYASKETCSRQKRSASVQTDQHVSKKTYVARVAAAASGAFDTHWPLLYVPFVQIGLF